MTIYNSGGSGGGSWGSITGTLSDQTDLQLELDGKQDTAPAASDGVLPALNSLNSNFYTRMQLSGLTTLISTIESGEFSGAIGIYPSAAADYRVARIGGELNIKTFVLDGKAYVRFAMGNNANGTIPLKIGTWNLIQFNVNASNNSYDVWVNGQYEELFATINNVASAINLNVGSTTNSANVENFVGRMAQCLVSSVKWTEAEAQEYYNGGSIPSSASNLPTNFNSGLEALIPLNDGTGTYSVDLASGGICDIFTTEGVEYEWLLTSSFVGCVISSGANIFTDSEKAKLAELHIGYKVYKERTEPTTPATGEAVTYLDAVDGNYKIKFDNGTVATLATKV